MVDRLRLPYAPAAVRHFLTQDEELVSFVPAELITTGDVPNPINRPFITCRPADTKGVDPKAKTAMVQVDVWVPPREVLQEEPGAIDADPGEVAWDLAGLCGQLLHHSDSRPFRGNGFKCKWASGPGAGPGMDYTRGKDQPLFRALVRIELSVSLMVTPKFYWAPS